MHRIKKRGKRMIKFSSSLQTSSSQGGGNLENRVFTRVNLSEWATVSYENQVFGGLVENISLRGLFVQTNQTLPLNMPVEVNVHHSIDKSLNLSATAVRQCKNGLGMRINRMDIHSLVYLRGLVEEQCQNPEQVMHETKKMVSYMLS